jgi:phosphate:Na+ symporter
VNGTQVLLEIAGAVALLLWGVRMVRTGVTRAYGADLRKIVGVCSRSRLKAFATGLGVTVVLQSSTATALIIASFAGRGLIAGVPALAIMLGADVGTTLVAQVLAFRPWWLSPLLIATGFLMFSGMRAQRGRHLGRVFIGLGLMLLALKLTGEASAPLRASEGLATVLAALADAPFVALLVAAVLTWLAHSSLAVILVVMSLAGNHLLPPVLALALVLGANVGGGIAPLMATAASGPAARRVPAGNLLMRTALALALLPALPYLAPWLMAVVPEPARAVVDAHTGFNLALAILMLPFLGLVNRLGERLLPEQPVADDPRQPRHLDPGALDTPREALACAAREAMRMGDHVERMLGRTIAVFETDDGKLAKEVEDEDNVVDALHEAIKLYLAGVSRNELDEEESRRSQEILSFTTNLEHIGDIVDKNLMELAAKKIKHRLKFSPAGFAEIRAFHGMVQDNLKLAFNVFVSNDPALARRLLSQKVSVRDAERVATEQHLVRVGAGRADSIETSSLHLDIIRDLKRINSHLTSVAYPILERTGEIAATRLLTEEARPRGLALFAGDDATGPAHRGS